MKWRRVPKEKSSQPVTGNYHDWKPLLAKEGFHQCVYCAISESAFGGFRNYHVEHYKPKSRYPKLENKFSNLFYACAICNTFKGDDWPGEPHQEHLGAAYPDPSLTDYALLFDVAPNGVVAGRNIAANYLVEKLYLNRPQLISERRAQAAFAKIDEFAAFVRAQMRVLQASARAEREVAEAYDKLLSILLDLIELQSSYYKIRPYNDGDVSRTT